MSCLSGRYTRGGRNGALDMRQTAPNRHFSAIAQKMTAAGMPDLAVRTFQHYYRQLLDGQSGLLGEDQIGPVQDTPSLAGWAGQTEAGGEALARTVIIKLNGGLGTSMGLNQAKSLLPARENLSFLELIARQVLHLRITSGHPVPLLLMNSFNTDADSLNHLARLPDLAAGQAPLPLSFVQHQVPRLHAATLDPIEWPAEPQREWCPPGHGDLYTVLHASGLLADLTARGYRYAFVSNADNLGATLNLDILGRFADEEIPFLMEVTERTAADRKGGHLARDHDGRLVLRESAQCPPDQHEQFQDIERYRYFNTNNLWLNLTALERELKSRDGILGLPMIRNDKHVVPGDSSTPKVIQLETAMGAAIQIFANARILNVPRTRFAPVKTTSDLLALWSDRYRVDSGGSVLAQTEDPLCTDLDERYFKTVEDFRARFPAGAPSLLNAERLAVEGNILFERDIVVRGRVRLVHRGQSQRRIAAGTVLEDLDETA